MSATWGDLNARARGLATHLASRPTLEQLAESPNLAILARDCVAAGVLPGEPEQPSTLGLELAFRRAAARPLQLLTRWMGLRTEALRFVLEDEERRSLRAVLRGAAAGVAAETRLSGLVPTPDLPERLLTELARQPHCRDVVALLIAWHHPYGPPLLPAVAGDPPDLFRLECELNRTFALRATRGARRGGKALRAFVEETIDLENLCGGLVLAASELELAPDAAFLPGGRRITLDAFRAAVKTRNPTRAADLLAAPFGDSEIARLARRHATDPRALEESLLRDRIQRLREQARRDPLGPAPLLWYLFRLRAQAVSLGLLVWGAALGVPPAARRDSLAGVA
jgi:vacuolar-type H+-ATPase subunit C/Vma6